MLRFKTLMSSSLCSISGVEFLSITSKAPKPSPAANFYVLYWLAVIITGKIFPNAGDIAKIDLSAISTDQIKGAIVKVTAYYLQFGGGDQLAKGTHLKAILEGALREELG